MKSSFFLKRYISLSPVVILSIFSLSFFIYLSARIFSPVADFLNSTVSVFVRRMLGLFSSVFPFSFFELLVIMIIPIIGAVVLLGLKRGKTKEGRIKYTVSLISVISLIATSYIYTLGFAYLTEPLADKLTIDSTSEITAEELYGTALKVRDSVNEYASLVEFSSDRSVMDLSIDELSHEVYKGYERMLDDFPVFKNYKSRVKPVLFSTVMSDAGITGIYSFFTGEANINMEYPDCDLPFTAAHEVAHAHGFGREDEANFLAFLACTYSENAYLKYSGYLNIFSYLASSLSRLDKELYKEIIEGLSDVAKADIKASSAVTVSHSGAFLGKVNDKANDIYLKSNGTEGTVSYGYVVRLAVAYYKEYPT